jgi:peptidoglycan/LPS O-acetylase OafA/YrhL
MRRFDVLDGWRGICALLVAVMHFDGLTTFYYWPFVRHTFLMVDFFFVLSGFVISHAYFDRIMDLRSTGNFLIRRFGRLWPLHALMLIVFLLFQILSWVAEQVAHFTFAVPPFTGSYDTASIVPNLLLLHSFDLIDHNSWNRPSWSISAEFWTYAVFGLITLVFRRYIVPIAVAVIAVSTTTIYLYAPKMIDSTFDFGLIRCFADFFAGVILQRLWRPINLSLTIATLLELGVLALVTIFAVCITTADPMELATPLVFTAAIWVFAHERGSISLLLQSRPARAIGTWSYSIYMVHMLIMIVLFRALPELASHALHMRKLLIPGEYEGEARTLLYPGSRIGADFLALIYAAIVLATSALTYRYIEAPWRDRFNRLAERLAGRRDHKTVSKSPMALLPTSLTVNAKEAAQ